MILARVTSNPCAAANNRAPGALMERPSVKEEITSVVNLNVCVQPRRDPLEAVAPQTIPSVMPMAMPMVILPAIVPNRLAPRREFPSSFLQRGRRDSCASRIHQGICASWRTLICGHPNA